MGHYKISEIKVIITILFIAAIAIPSMAVLDLSKVKTLVGPVRPLAPTKTLGTAVWVFLSNDCPCSVGFYDHLRELRKRHPSFEFLGVVSNYGEDWELSAKTFKELQLGFPILKDDEQLVAKHFKALKTPHAFVTDSKGQVVYSGGVSDRRFFKDAKQFYLQEVLLDLSEGKKPRYSHQRTLGCYIRRKP